MSELTYILEVIFMLFGILISCQIFTNAIENLGDKLNLNHEFTGSILAAIGTALPETILPLVAIYMATHGDSTLAKNDIAIGAIIGGPFMLSTLAMLLLGLSIFVHNKKRQKTYERKLSLEDAVKVSKQLNFNQKHLERDLKFFLMIFTVAIGSTFFSTAYVTKFINYLCSTELGIRLLNLINLGHLGSIPNRCFDNLSFTLKLITVALIISLYCLYLIKTYKASTQEIGEEEGETPELYLTRIFKLKNTSAIFVLIQTLIGLGGIIYFAHHFVDCIEDISGLLTISPLVLSLIISPIATELPEKVNSWIWVSESKDTLAIGNLTGAMVFQSTVPCLIGILLTPWELDKYVFICSTVTIISAVFLLTMVKTTKRLGYQSLWLCGTLYLVYLYSVFFT